MDSSLIETCLTALGVGDFDAELYSLLLYEKTRSIAEMARALGTHRARIYESLERLKQAGLVCESEEKGATNRRWVVESPTVVLARLRLQENRLRRLSRDLSETIPALLAACNPAPHDGVVQVCAGRAQFVRLMADLYEAFEGEILWIGEGHEIYSITGEPFMNHELGRIRKRRNLQAKILAGAYNTALARRLETHDDPLRQVRFLPAHFDTKVTVSITKETIISWNTVLPRAIAIHDPLVAKAHLQQFATLWQHAKSKKPPTG